MEFINLATGIIVSTQTPLDGKLYVLTLDDLKDLGANNYKAYHYYDGMRVFCNENKTVYIWREVTGDDIAGILDTPFVYPNGLVNEIDYSNKTFDFFIYNAEADNENLPDKIYNGTVYWLEIGLNFRSTIINYRINDVEHQAPITDLTLDPADATHPRKDVFAVNTSNQVVIIKGTPSLNPQEPPIVFGEQLRIGLVDIPANATIPGNAATEIIYNEYLGIPDEWDVTTPSIPAQDYDPESTDCSMTDAKAIKVTNITAAHSLLFSKGSFVDLENLSSLRIDLKSAVAENFQLYIKIGNSVTGLGVGGVLLNPGEYGFNPLSTDVQNIDIPIALFNINDSPIDSFTIGFRLKTISSITSLCFDNLRLLYGGEPFVFEGISIRDTNNIHQFQVLDFLRVKNVKFNPLQKEIEIVTLIANTVFIDANATNIVGVIGSLQFPFKTDTEALAALPPDDGTAWTLFFIQTGSPIIVMNEAFPEREIIVRRLGFGTLSYSNVIGFNNLATHLTVDAPRCKLLHSNAAGSTFGCQGVLKIDVDEIEIATPSNTLTSFYGFLVGSRTKDNGSYVKCNVFRKERPDGLINYSGDFIVVDELIPVNGALIGNGGLYVNLKLNTVRFEVTSGNFEFMSGNGVEGSLELSEIIGTGIEIRFQSNYERKLIFQFNDLDLDSNLGNIYLFYGVNNQADVTIRGTMRNNNVPLLMTAEANSVNLKLESFNGRLGGIGSTSDYNITMFNSVIRLAAQLADLSIDNTALVSLALYGNNTFIQDTPGELIINSTGFNVDVYGDYKMAYQDFGANVTVTEHTPYPSIRSMLPFVPVGEALVRKVSPNVNYSIIEVNDIVFGKEVTNDVGETIMLMGHTYTNYTTDNNRDRYENYERPIAVE